MKYHTLFYSKIRKDVAKFVVCCSRDWLIIRSPILLYMSKRELMLTHILVELWIRILSNNNISYIIQSNEILENNDEI